MGGSQLKQLKAAIVTSGISQHPSNSRKRKRGDNGGAGRGGAVVEHRDKRVEKLREIHEKFNPFDVKVQKVKHDVVGRKMKGIMGKPSASKQAGIEQRKKTLLVEYELKDKVGGIVDRRFGENDPTMSPEERMLARFTKERQRSSKGFLYNLEDEDELTHYGQSLSKLDDFDNVGLHLDDDDEEGGAGQIDAVTVKSAHFKGFSEDEEENTDDAGPPKKKTKAEVMAEVIAKSKEHKYARQLQREQDESTRHALDDDFDSIRNILFSKPRMESPPPLPDSFVLPTPVAAATRPTTNDVPTDKDYDLFVHELAMDKRAQPKDRTKTEKEIALEEKEALVLAEKKRLRRMMGEPEESEEEVGGRAKRSRGGDDLDDDFILEDDTFEGIGPGLKDDEEAADDIDQDEEEEDQGSSKGESGPEGTDSDDDNEDYGPSDEGEEAEEGVPEEIAPIRSKKTKSPLSKRHAELPFTFSCPSSHDEFLDIVENVDDSLVGTVVERIRKLYHPSLHIENKSRLQALAGVLLDHIIYSATLSPPSFTVIETLVPHLYALTKAYPISTAEKFVTKLNLLQKNFTRGLQDPLDPSSKTFPGLAELVFLRVLGETWSTSDMKHAVVGLARYLMGAYLGLGRIRNLKDIASGLALCSLFLQYEELSKRLVPEIVNFVVQTLLLLFPVAYPSAKTVPGHFPIPDFDTVGSMLRFRRKRAGDINPKLPSLFRILNGDDNGEQEKLDLMSLSLELVRRCADMYKSLDGFIELYGPILTIVDDLPNKKLPPPISLQIGRLSDTLSRLLKFAKQARQPLLLQLHKPIPIATYIPKFDAHGSSYMRHKDPDAEREALAKLRAQHRKEKKGAMRELRKDNRFLAGVQQEKQEAKDREYKARMAKVFAGLESERAEQRKEEKEKKRQKRRSGRK